MGFSRYIGYFVGVGRERVKYRIFENLNVYAVKFDFIYNGGFMLRVGWV